MRHGRVFPPSDSSFPPDGARYGGSDKVSNEAFPGGFPCTKIRLGGFFCILRRFAKCRLSPVLSFLFPSGRSNGRDVSFCLFTSVSICSFNSFRNVDCLVLPESETRNSFLPFSKDLTSADETILFGSRNNIVPGTFCLYSENEMCSFLKSKAFSGIFVCII